MKRGTTLKRGSQKPFTKSRKLTSDLLDQAYQFHGHKGAFIALGLRMGLLALKELAADGFFDMRCVVKLPYRPPYSCIVDGIQVSTGCTMGKRNIEVEEGEGIEALFEKSEKKRKISLRHDVLNIIHENLEKGEEMDTDVFRKFFVESEESELFLIG